VHADQLTREAAAQAAPAAYGEAGERPRPYRRADCGALPNHV